MEIEDQFSEKFNSLLPQEIIILFYEYLPLTDIKSASLVSKYWYEASLHSSVTQRRLIPIKKDRLKNGVSYNEIAFSKIPYSNLKISVSKECMTHKSFWKTVSENLRFLAVGLWSFKDCTDFLSTVKFLVNLETLHINVQYFQNDTQMNCTDVFQLNNVKTLRYQSELEKDSLLKELLKIMTEIVHWDLSYDQPQNLTVHETILNYLKTGKDRIKTLILRSNLATIKSILDLTGMNLTTFSLEITDTYYNDSDDSDIPDDQWQGTPCDADYRSLYSKIENFTDDKKLLRIKLSNPSLFDLIDTNYPNLEEIFLEISNDFKGTVKKLELFSKFETVHLYKNNSFMNMDVDISDILKDAKKNLKKLILCCENDPQYALSSSVLRLTSLKNLTRLILDDCGFNHEQEPKEVFDAIFQMRQLKYLYINDNLIDHDTSDDNERDYDPYEQSHAITDNVFCGTEETEDGDEQCGHSISELTNLIELHVNIKNSNLNNPTLIELFKLEKLESLSFDFAWVSIDAEMFKERTQGRVNAVFGGKNSTNWRPLTVKKWKSKYFNIRKLI